MKGGKNEEKIMSKSPMFPRLHVNDTERGGPRAPPRNKMALYEQLSIPSQRLCSPSPSPHAASNERSVFTQFCNSPAPSLSTNNLHSCSSNGIKLNTMTDRRCLNTSETTSSTSKCDSMKPTYFPDSKKLFLNKTATTQLEMDPLCSKDRNFADASSKLLSDEKYYESLKRAHTSLNQENRSSSVDVSNSLQSMSMRLHQGILMETESCSRTSLGDNNTTGIGLENGSECHEDNNWRDTARQDAVSDTSTVDLTVARVLSPDIVLGVIGEKQFWRVRRALVNQQRLFALQVFELHRLIKVQKLIAESPYLLLEDNLCAAKHPSRISQVKKFQSECIPEQPPLLLKAKDTCNEFADENAVVNLPHFSANKDVCKGSMTITQESNFRSYSETAPATSKGKPSTWCFPPPKTQWLISVMSPSEGLIYKPYIGPIPPPAAAFMAPFYGPTNLTPTCGNILNPNTTCGSSPLGQTSFPPYGMPIMNPSISGSAFEFSGPRSKDNFFSMDDTNVVIPHQNLCNMPNQTSGMIHCSFGNVHASKEVELLGSTARSVSERAKEDALPLFPMEPIVKSSEKNEQHSRVIKVVPHNPKPSLRKMAASNLSQGVMTLQMLELSANSEKMELGQYPET